MASFAITSELHCIANELNPHRYQFVCMAETDFGRMDLYHQLALSLAREAAHRRSHLLRNIKVKITELGDGMRILLVWIIDEAQNLPPKLFRDLSSLINFAFNLKNLMTVWFLGHPTLAQPLTHGPSVVCGFHMKQLKARYG